MEESKALKITFYLPNAHTQNDFYSDNGYRCTWQRPTVKRYQARHIRYHILRQKSCFLLHSCHGSQAMNISFLRRRSWPYRYRNAPFWIECFTIRSILSKDREFLAIAQAGHLHSDGRRAKLIRNNALVPDLWPVLQSLPLQKNWWLVIGCKLTAQCYRYFMLRDPKPPWKSISPVDFLHSISKQHTYHYHIHPNFNKNHPPWNPFNQNNSNQVTSAVMPWTMFLHHSLKHTFCVHLWALKADTEQANNIYGRVLEYNANSR